MWPSGLNMAMTLTLDFQGQIWNWLYLCKNGPIAMKQKANTSIELYASNVAMTLTLNFQGQIWNLLHLNQKWSDCHEMKSKHINLNSRPQIW